MLSKKYQPNSLKEIIGHAQELKELKKFIINYRHGTALLLFGLIGCGKTSAVCALAKDLSLELVELNSSETRNAEAIESQFVNAIKQKSLFADKKIILIDDIDGLTSSDRGGLSRIIARIPESIFPVILTCNNPFDQKFKELRKVCSLLRFSEIPLPEILGFLKEVCKKESLDISSFALSNIARSCNSDLRAALFDLECNAEYFGERDREKEIKETLGIILKSSSVNNVSHILQDTEPGEIMLWLSENLPKEYSPCSLKLAYHYLSRADLFLGRIHKWQHWRFLSYISLFLSAGIAVSKKAKSDSTAEYTRPSRLLKIWLAKSMNAKRQEKADSYAQIAHISNKKALSELPFITFLD
ncbi:AAA family ATPase [archaeon]|nr:AAA family ATPase [archaeon]